MVKHVDVKQWNFSGGARSNYVSDDLDDSGPPLIPSAASSTSIVNNTSITDVTPQTITITLTNDTWVASGATFDAVRQAIRDGMTSSSGETNGWTNEIANDTIIPLTNIVRTSATVVTVTVNQAANYAIGANETVDILVPAAALVLTATPLASTAVSIFIVTVGQIFFWDVESGTVNSTFNDRNRPDDLIITTEQAFAGSQSMKVRYPGNEATPLMYKYFPPTLTLYCRKREFFAAEWLFNMPLGLKMGRYFTDQAAGSINNVYFSEKNIYEGYTGTYPNRPTDVDGFSHGFNHSIGAATGPSREYTGTYPIGTLFANGLPYIRPGYWYTIETYLVMNSAMDVADGSVEIRIDGVVIVDEPNTAFRDTASGMVNGTHWQGLFFGGNYSNGAGDAGHPGGEPNLPPSGPGSDGLRRYIDDMYLSTTDDWLSFP